MGKVIAQIMVSLDGCMEGPNQEIDWHRVDEAYNDYAAKLLNRAGAILLGRATYELMARYWPTPGAVRNDPVIAGFMNRLPKIVFSTTLEHVDWANSRLAEGDAADEIRRLKEQPGGDMVLLGSAELASALTAEGLIDEYEIMVNPVVLGGGKPYFKTGLDRLPLKLEGAETYRSGNVLLRYRREG